MQGIISSETTANISSEENEGYRLVSWYRVPNIMVDKIEENHNYFDTIFSENQIISKEKDLNNVTIQDNDLFVAHFQAKVLYHDINGNIIDIQTGNVKNEVEEKDWYNYEEQINYVEPVNRPESENAKLIGFTTTKSTEKGGGYSSITSPELTALKNSNSFYEIGDKITKTMDLYPVYVDSISNINTVFEGNEQDSINDESLREGVGHTIISMNEAKNVVVTVTGENDDGTFPTGYRFLGWYDEEGNRITNETSYELKDIDLTQKHTFTAKFEYLVEYYVRAFGQHNGAAFTESELFESRYQKYNTEFVNISAPGYIKEYISHWGTEHVNHGKSDNKSDAYSGKIVSPLKVYSHNNIDGGQTFYQAFVTTDFPGAGRINDEHDITGGKFRFIPESDRYSLQFWTLERESKGWSYLENPMETGVLDPRVEYRGMAMVTADIIFHKKQGEDVTVTRRYHDKLFMEEDTEHTYKYPFWHADDNVSTNPEDSSSQLDNTITLPKSPKDEEMNISNYVFLGWISSQDVKEDSSEWNYIYDVKDDLYCTTDINKVKPYLLQKDYQITQAIDVYPVYAKYNVETKTNVNINLPEEINANKPANPKFVINEDKENIGKATVTLTPDTNTFVIGNSGEKYVLSSLVRVYEDTTEEEIKLDENGNYKYEIEAGKKYTFMAKYETVILVYHLNNEDIKNEIRKTGEMIETMPSPTYDVKELKENYIFVGWSSTKPSNGYHKLSTYSDTEKINMVNITNTITNSMELWPVYVKIQISVNSNIDSELTNSGISPEGVRYITRPDLDKSQLEAKDVEGYNFVGWYKNYVNSDNKGELVTSNKMYLLQREESLQKEIYTAVYVRAYTINYYDTNGNVIYFVGVTQDENRTFVDEVIDNEGNKVSIPIDYEAYQIISSKLNLNESFRNWQWVKKDGTIVSWEDFYNKKINSNMDLYPIVRKITVEDSNGNNIETIGTDEKAPDIVLGISNKKIYAYFNIDYNKPNMTVHVEDLSYSSDKTDISYIKDVEVIIYKNNNMAGEILDSKLTDENGDAFIEFTGEIILSVNTKENNEDLFSFQIFDDSDNLVNEVLVAQEETKTIKLPYGNYIVKKESNWSWRYKDEFNKDISINNNNDIIDIKYEQPRGILKWFDFTSKKDNEYTK